MKIQGEKTIELTNTTSLEIEDQSSVVILITPKSDSKVSVKIGKNCRVSSFIIQQDTFSLEQINSIGENSQINTFALWLGSGTGKILNHLDGKKSQAYDVEIFIQNKENKIHLDSVLKHGNDDTKGNILIKGIVKDNASVKIDGMIKIEKNGGGAESFLSEHVMLLNPGAHATANPELEIENNDVSSRHAASISQIDEEKIFYLISRGVNREQARNMIIYGFLESAINKIEDEKIRESFMEKILNSV